MTVAPGDPTPATPPQTGDAAIDEALLGLADLAGVPLAEQHERLTAAHETLQNALDRTDDAIGSPPHG